MKIAYLYPEHFGQDTSRILQVVATIRALARCGVQVILIIGWFIGINIRLRQLKLYNIPGIKIIPVFMCQYGAGLYISFSWHKLFYISALYYLRSLVNQGVTWVMLRHLKLADYLLPYLSKLGINLLFEVHEIFSQTAIEEGANIKKIKLLRAMETRVYYAANSLVAISRPLAEALQVIFNLTKIISVASSGVDENFFNISSCKREFGLLAYIGGLAPWKGVDLLLEAIVNVPSIRLEILGGRPGSTDWFRVHSLSNLLGVSSQVVLRPQASRIVVHELLSRAEIAIYPGNSSQRIAAEFTSPLKLFEYLASGCAVIAPNLPAIRSIIYNAKQIRLFLPDNPFSLGLAINELISNHNQVKVIGVAGRELARSYTWEARANILINLMDRRLL